MLMSHRILPSKCFGRFGNISLLQTNSTKKLIPGFRFQSRLYSLTTIKNSNSNNKRNVASSSLSNDSSIHKMIGESTATAIIKDSSCKAMIFSSAQEVGHLAEGRSILLQGDSLVHATVCSSRTDLTSPELDAHMLPMTVDYRSRQYAFGRIPDTILRRERHGGDEEILVARVIDRAIRPLFPKV